MKVMQQDYESPPPKVLNAGYRIHLLIKKLTNEEVKEGADAKPQTVSISKARVCNTIRAGGGAAKVMERALAFVGLVLLSAFLFDNYCSPEPTVSNFLSENIGAVVITGELLIFLVCGVVLGLCAVSPKVMLAVAPIIFVNGIIWDTYFLGRVYLVSIVVCSLSVMYLLLGWAVWYYRRNRRQK